jgi:hypothetical protein
VSQCESSVKIETYVYRAEIFKPGRDCRMVVRTLVLLGLYCKPPAPTMYIWFRMNSGSSYIDPHKTAAGSGIRQFVANQRLDLGLRFASVQLEPEQVEEIPRLHRKFSG